jgi:hypothetical protein
MLPKKIQDEIDERTRQFNSDIEKILRKVNATESEIKKTVTSLEMPDSLIHHKKNVPLGRNLIVPPERGIGLLRFENPKAPHGYEYFHIYEKTAKFYENKCFICNQEIGCMEEHYVGKKTIKRHTTTIYIHLKHLIQEVKQL